MRNFYLDEAHWPGWELTDADNSLMLFLKKGDRTMIISFSKGWVSLNLEYRLTRNGANRT